MDRWTSFQQAKLCTPYGNDMIPTNPSSPYKNVDSDEIDIKHEIIVEHEDMILSNCEEQEEGEVRNTIELGDDPLGDLAVPNYSYIRDNFRPQVFVGGPPNIKVKLPPETSCHVALSKSEVKPLTRLETKGFHIFKKTVRDLRSKKPPSSVMKTFPTGSDFPCRLCGKKFRTRWDMIRHLYSVHTSIVCNRNFAEKTELDRQNETECEDASSIRIESTLAPKLNGTSNRVSEFRCPVCSKTFGKKGHLTRHLLSHEPEKPFGCELCPKRFMAKYSLQMHLLNRHKIDATPHDCSKCEKRFCLKEELDQHYQSHDSSKQKVSRCDKCEQKFISPLDLDSHLQISHPEGWLRCSFNSCDKIFYRKYNLIRHERTHRAEKLYHCDVCKKEFGTKDGFRGHLQSHEDTNEKNFSCHMCNRKFSVKQNLEMHLGFHNKSDGFPFSCELCEVRFKTEERLKEHIDRHASTEGIIFQCSYCDRNFPRRYNWIRHERSHTHGRKKPKNGSPIRREFETSKE